jgi:hypothetical protein
MDGIGANSVNNVGNVNGYKPAQKAEKQASEYTPKTGDLNAYLESVGNSQRMLVKKHVSPEKLAQQLKGDEKFLKKNCPDVEITDAMVSEFRALVNEIPLPKDPSVLDGQSLENYKRTQALKQINN